MAGKGSLGTWVRDYFTATRRPLYSIIVAAPFFIAYELGIAFLKDRQPPEAQVYNKAAYILKSLASVAGEHAAYILPVLLGMGLLLYLDWRGRKERRERAAKGLPGFQPAYIGWMFLEGLLLAMPLRLVLPEIYGMFSAGAGPGGEPASGGASRGSFLFQLTTYCGAGAYEELLFRLFLFMGLFWLGRLVKLEKPAAGILAAVVAGVVFAIFHPQGNPWSAHFEPQFLVFASLAGVYFSAICLYRSFGMAVATHASFDIMSMSAGALA